MRHAGALIAMTVLVQTSSAAAWLTTTSAERLLALGIGPERLAAAGISPSQLELQIETIELEMQARVAMDTASMTLDLALQELSEAREDYLRDPTDPSAALRLESAAQEVAAARAAFGAARDRIMEVVLAPLAQNHSERLLTCLQGRDCRCPAPYAVIRRSDAEWRALERGLTAIARADRRGEEADASVIEFIEGCLADSEVTQARLDVQRHLAGLTQIFENNSG